jgi:hypothetical protein
MSARIRTDDLRAILAMAGYSSVSPDLTVFEQRDVTNPARLRVPTSQFCTEAEARLVLSLTGIPIEEIDKALTDFARTADPRPDQIRHTRIALAIDEIYRLRRPSYILPISQKEKLYDQAASMIGDRLRTFLEFGVYEGWSIRRIAQRFTNRGTRFFGFDSFIGLPEDWAPNMPAGHFSTKEQHPDIGDTRVQFVKGWFQNTVPGCLRDHAPLPEPVLVNFNADLYSSTLFLLTTLWHFLPEYHFFFDEFVPDEIAAMYEFVAAYPVEFEFFGATEDECQRPQQVFGRIRNVPFQL